MSASLQVSTSTPNYQLILDKALSEYKKKTKKDLITDPLASNDERLTKWLTPTVNVLNALSATLGQGVGIVFPPTQIIFSGINILLVAARDKAASRDSLVELFEKSKTSSSPTDSGDDECDGKDYGGSAVYACNRDKGYEARANKNVFKNLVGRKDIDGALQRLDKLEQGELRTVTAQVLKTTSDIKGVTSDLRDAASELKDDAKETKVMVQQFVSEMSAHECSERLLEELQGCAQHERTATWIFNEDTYIEWESSGSLLWIHGKAGSGKSILWFVLMSCLRMHKLIFSVSSAIIQHVLALRNSGSASAAYFYFDFRDENKKHRRDLLSSLLMQLSSRSAPCLNVLSRLYSTHNNGKEQPSERTLVQCLKDMLMATSLSELPTFIILDAIDECPNSFGIPTPREQVLELVKDLADLRLPNLRICMTSRPEIDIRTALEPLASRHLSLHDQPGQKRDITEYVNAVVQSDVKMKRWREDDRKLIIDTLSGKADGM
ncbi:hypothetical protein EI94DRAFT_1810667 [Lactarius quietus]|nr:hypothetical protein EI94DRAFT_1810667 [Lactarius quietus]